MTDLHSQDPRVLIVLDASAAWSRGVLRGLMDIARKKKWTLLHYHPSTDVRWLLDVWTPSIVVLQPAAHPEAAEALKAYPVVAVNNDQPGDWAGSVSVDDDSVGHLAAAHLSARGFQTLTTFRFNDDPIAVARERSFVQAVVAHDRHLVPGWWDYGGSHRTGEDPEALTSWLSGLPTPCGIFAVTDSWARVVARYARVAGIRIPEQLALVGADNDAVDCELCVPPLSSVAVPWRAVGERTAELVDRVLSGTLQACERFVVQPLDVVPRRSTDVCAVDDPIVARAIGWIEEHAARRVTLGDVARGASCSRQRLEQRFRSALDRTVMQEVRRVRVDMAKRLLLTTRLRLPDVAAKCGFTSAALLSVAFRRETATPPGAYRRQLLRLLATDE